MVWLLFDYVLRVTTELPRHERGFFIAWEPSGKCESSAWYWSCGSGGGRISDLKPVVGFLGAGFTAL